MTAGPKKRGPDRRVLRTRRMLQEALTEMMTEKGYESTTVQDIIDRANVGRSTFYAHFADKDTLLSSAIEDLRSELVQEQQRALDGPGGPDVRGLGFSLPMLEHAQGQVQLWEAIVGRESGAVVLQRLHRIFVELAEIDLRALGFEGPAAQRDLAAQFVASAFTGVLRWWLDGGATLVPLEVDAIVRRLVMRGLATELGLKVEAS